MAAHKAQLPEGDCGMNAKSISEWLSGLQCAPRVDLDGKCNPSGRSDGKDAHECDLADLYKETSVDSKLLITPEKIIKDGSPYDKHSRQISDVSTRCSSNADDVLDDLLPAITSAREVAIDLQDGDQVDMGEGLSPVQVQREQKQANLFQQLTQELTSQMSMRDDGKPQAANGKKFEPIRPRGLAYEMDDDDGSAGCAVQ
mmetsp:Transcript_8394/g.14217  ORF Transcript_8394/g.14217 Transcript_8394/m.14217 type:complete len:200 (+) Transcript_8394:79-678(+)